MARRVLLDTHLLLWAALLPERLPAAAARIMQATENTLYFSVCSLWETAIKLSRPRKDLVIDLSAWRTGLLDNGYLELPILAEHTLAVQQLPALHQDPFDRLLLAQARCEKLELLTADAQLAAYGAPVLQA